MIKKTKYKAGGHKSKSGLRNRSFIPFRNGNIKQKVASFFYPGISLGVNGREHAKRDIFLDRVKRYASVLKESIHDSQLGGKY